MKRFIIALTMLLALTVNAAAMSYSQARDRALFLTDKMAYELNLTEEQYEAAYEVNLDYLMSINTYDDLYGTYWANRNLDLSYILLDWQYRAFCAANYFYRPVYWNSGVWHFSIYARYPRRTYFYFGRPAFYTTYRGGHGWRMNGGRSWYRGRDFNRGYIARGHGMKDRFDRGDFRPDRRYDRNDYGRPDRNDRVWNDSGSNRPDRNNNRPDFNGSRPGLNDDAYNRGTDRNNGYDRPQRFTPGRNEGGRMSDVNGYQNTPQRRFGGSRNDNRVNRESSTRTTVRPQRMGGTSFRSTGEPQRSMQSLPSTPRNTFSPRGNSGSSQSVRQAPVRSSGDNSAPTRSSGGGHFGGRR